MLIASGNGVTGLIDYTNKIDQNTIDITQSQGDTLPEAKCQFTDQISAVGLNDEDDIVFLDETDGNGWPAVNLLTNGGMEGTYVSNVAPGWTGNNTGASGVTIAATSSAFIGTRAQQISFLAVSNGTSCNFDQTVQIPRDYAGNVLRSQRYCLSGWLYCGTFSDATFWLRFIWKDSGGSVISDLSYFYDTSIINTWQYGSAVGFPPANATQITVQLITTINTGGGTGNVVRWDAIHLEPCTFANVKSLSYTPPIRNPLMNYHGTGGVVDGWRKSATTNGTFTGVSSPTLNTTAQKIVTSNATANGSNQIIQSTIRINAFQTYTATVNFQLIIAFTGTASFRWGINWSDLGHNYLSTFSTPNVTAVPINTWLPSSLRVGPGTSLPIPVTAAYAEIFVGIDNGGSGTNAGQLVIGSVTITPDSSQLQGLGLEMTAFNAGLYPTPYAGSEAPGCYPDRDLSGCYYRQLRLFGGFVRKTSFDYSMSPERIIDIDAVGYGVLLQEAPANFVIQQEEDINAIAFACTYAHNQGFLQGLDWTTYVSDIQMIDSMTFNWQTTKDVLTQIANTTVAAYWVDDYKYLHYIPNLAFAGPFALSDVPDMVNTFPFSNWKYDTDSTQSVSTVVYEGATVLSLPVTDSNVGLATTTTANLTAGTPYTALTVTATSVAVASGTLILIGTDDHVITSAAVLSGVTSIPIISFTPGTTISSGATVKSEGFVLNGGNAIAQVDSCTVGGVTQRVGISGIDQFAGGFDALVDVNGASISFATPPGNGVAVLTTYRYSAPVIVRLSRAPTGTHRMIFHHQKEDTITSIDQAINRSNADLNQYSTPRPIGTLDVYCPPAPLAQPLRVGQAIQITHQSSGLSAQLFQIQQVEVFAIGPGVTKYSLTVGYYRPDFAVQYAHTRESLVNANTVNTQGQAVTEVLSLIDGWAMTDSLIAPVITNIGKWGGPSTWDSPSYAWG